MRPESKKITLGSSEFTINPLTLRQLQAILPITDEINELNKDNKVTTTIMIEEAIKVIKIALGRDYHEVAVDDLEMTPADINKAFRIILVQGGLAEAAPGETVAAL